MGCWNAFRICPLFWRSSGWRGFLSMMQSHDSETSAYASTLPYEIPIVSFPRTVSRPSLNHCVEPITAANQVESPTRNFDRSMITTLSACGWEPQEISAVRRAFTLSQSVTIPRGPRLVPIRLNDCKTLTPQPFSKLTAITVRSGISNLLTFLCTYGSAPSFNN
jgi:hypothetical protein